ASGGRTSGKFSSRPCCSRMDGLVLTCPLFSRSCSCSIASFIQIPPLLVNLASSHPFHPLYHLPSAHAIPCLTLVRAGIGKDLPGGINAHDRTLRMMPLCTFIIRGRHSFCSG